MEAPLSMPAKPVVLTVNIVVKTGTGTAGQLLRKAEVCAKDVGSDSTAGACCLQELLYFNDAQSIKDFVLIIISSPLYKMPTIRRDLTTLIRRTDDCIFRPKFKMPTSSWDLSLMNTKWMCTGKRDMVRFPRMTAVHTGGIAPLVHVVATDSRLRSCLHRELFRFVHLVGTYSVLTYGNATVSRVLSSCTST